MKAWTRILAATDFSDVAGRAVGTAARLARRLGAQLEIVHAITPIGAPAVFIEPSEVHRRLGQDARAKLEKLRDEITGLDVKVTVIDVTDPAVTIAKYARGNGVDLCVVGSHGRTGLSQAWLGSVAELVVRHAHCDVMVVPARAKDAEQVPKQRIVAATDFSETSMAGIDVAGRLATMLDARLDLLHVIDSPLPRLRAWERLTELRAERLTYCPNVTTDVVVDANPRDAITQYADEPGVGLLVIGTHGVSNLKEMLLGSIAERVVRHSPCPVVVARH